MQCGEVPGSPPAPPARPPSSSSPAGGTLETSSDGQSQTDAGTGTEVRGDVQLLQGDMVDTFTPSKRRRKNIFVVVDPFVFLL